MALVLPLTIKLGPTAGLIMLAGIYYGSMYGGSTTSILVNVPGEAASVVTTIDGYRLARKGRAGAALAIAAHRVVRGRHLQRGRAPARRAARRPAALAFGPAEYFAFALLGVVLLANLTGGARAKSLAMVVTGRHAVHRRHGPPRRHRALHLRRGGRPGRAQLHRGDGRPVRRGRGAGHDGRAGGRRRRWRACASASCTRAARSCGARCRRCCAARCWASWSASSPARRRRSRPSCRTAWRSACRATGTRSGPAPSRAWPGPRRPTTRRPAAAWSRCSRSACRSRHPPRCCSAACSS